MNISFLNEKSNKYLIYILLGILVLVVLFPTNSVEGTKENANIQESMSQETMEEQLKRVLSAMEGVGKVEVMITTQSARDNLFGNEAEDQNVCGVLVVAEGAGVPSVNARILEAVKALFSIDVHKISIVKMRSLGG